MTAIANNEPIQPVTHPQMRVREKRVMPLDNKMHRYICNMTRVNVQQFEAAEAMNTSPEL